LAGIEGASVQPVPGGDEFEPRRIRVALAKKHRQPAFVIPHSRLHDIEKKNKIPSIDLETTLDPA